MTKLKAKISPVQFANKFMNMNFNLSASKAIFSFSNAQCT